MAECLSGTAIPTNNDPLECNEIFSTNCVAMEAAITYLELPAGSSLTTIINAFVLSLMDARSRIQQLESNA